jgi:putative transposase
MIAQARHNDLGLSVRHLCGLLGVGRSWYYEHPSMPTGAERDVALRDAIERIVLDFPGYGYRRVTKALAREGWSVNHKRVLRVMREASLLCQLKRRFVVTTDSEHALRTDPNLLAGYALTGQDQAWVADITYIRLPTAFAYLACILDAWSRRCVGWRLSRTIDTRLTLAALERALTARSPAPGLIHHSDHGVQYASTDYVARLDRIEARISMAAVGTPMRMPRPKASSSRSSARRCICRSTERLRRPRSASGGSSPMSTMPSACIRASATYLRSNSRHRLLR